MMSGMHGVDLVLVAMIVGAYETELCCEVSRRAAGKRSLGGRKASSRCVVK